MRLVGSSVVAALASGAPAIAGGGVAIASHVRGSRSGNVPIGFLAAHIRVEEAPVWRPLARAAAASGAEVTVQHIRLNPNQPIPWHTHPGPVFVLIERGAFTYEYAQGGKCLRTTYGASTGFVDPGFGTRPGEAGPAGAEIYALYVLPPGSEITSSRVCGPGLHVLM